MDEAPPGTANAPPAGAAPSPSHAPAPPQGAPGGGAELARQLAGQIAALGRPLPPGPVEITLEVEELGRVRMQLEGKEAAISVHITVERPETAALFRRHIETLAAELRAMGYAETAFEFGGHPGGQENRHAQRAGAAATPAGEDAAPVAPAPPSPAQPPRPRTVEPHRLDLKI
ncbi:MAG: flagellar hook-length control protein FliK [Alphaproteobacteria bacterium]|nr:MAG: flagellar hook-length control protein FliK [Alphaproteobacteria bacterium]